MALEDLNPAVRVEEILDGADIEPANRLEYFLKKAAGSGLPAYTSADKGKVLTIGDGAPQTEVVVPEQTWEQAEGTTMHDLAGADWTGIEVGDDVVVTLNGNTFNATVQGNSSGYQILYGNSNQIVYVFSSGATKSSIITSETQTYTLSVSKNTASVEPKWESASSGSGGAFNVIITHDSSFTQLNSNHTYEEIVYAATNGMVVQAILVSIDPNTGESTFPYGFWFNLAHLQTGASDRYKVAIFYGYDSGTMHEIDISADGTIYYD